jgi:hypothetical protein
MKYMLLIYNDPAIEPAYGTPEFQTMMGGYFALNEKLKADGVMRGGEGLKGINTATSLKVRDGKIDVMDGPFAETKEHLGGYYVIEVADLDAALKYAAMVPSAQHGTIEIRPLLDYNPAG